MQSKNSALHNAALQLAAAGIPVFPCGVESKKPAVEHGFHDASTDPAQIDAWWTENPNYNVAYCPHEAGLGVVDLDGEAGEQSWVERQFENGFAPETYTVRTPRGGRHLYYDGELPASQGTPTKGLGVHVDTRGVGSYVLAPPSRVRNPDGTVGQYEVIDSRIPAEVPAWIAPHLESQRKAQIAAPANVRLDHPSDIARAVKLLQDYVRRGHVAVEGEMGDNRTFAVAAEMKDLGVSPEKTLEIMLEHWNPYCDPPWEEDELETKIKNANANPQIEAGAFAVGSPSEVFGPILGSLGLDVVPPGAERRSPYFAFGIDELRSRPKLPFLIPEILPSRAAAMLWGPPDSYKTFVAIALAMPIALTQDVLFVAGEDAEGVADRVNAWCLANDVDPATGHKLRIVENMPWAQKPEMLIDFVEEVKRSELRPALVILDTAARMMVGLDESSARDAGLFVEAIDNLKKALQTTVLVIHHSGKDAGRGERGSTAIRGGFDVSLEASADTETAAVAVWVRKMKSTARRKEPLTYEGKAFAGSFVLFPTTPKEHRLLTHSEDIASNKKVGGALVTLKAIGRDNGVTTRVVAAHLLPAGDESPEAREEAVTKLGRSLQARAGDGGKLEGYVTKVGREYLWHVPEAEA